MVCTQEFGEVRGRVGSIPPISLTSPSKKDKS